MEPFATLPPHFADDRVGYVRRLFCLAHQKHVSTKDKSDPFGQKKAQRLCFSE